MWVPRSMGPRIVRIAALLGVAWLVPRAGTAQDSIPWPRADRLAVVVRARLVPAGGDSIGLSYELANGGASEQAAMTFVVRIDLPAYRVAGPALWWGSNAVVQDSAAAHWFVVDGRAVVQPGATLSGFQITAVGLTEPVLYRVQGFHQPPAVAEGELVQTPPSFWTNSIAGISVGVAPFPPDSAPDAVLSRLAALTTRACDVGWVTPAACGGLTGDVEAARQAVGQADLSGARSGIQSFLNQVNGLSDEAMALLKPNGAFALRQLGSGGPPSIGILDPAGDTYIRSGNPNQNQGTESILRVRPDGDNRTLIRFDQAAVAAVVGTRTVTSAQLELTIAENFDNWGPSGRTLDLHRLTQSWTETGATWSCGDDLEPGDPNPDCPATAWAMDGSGTRPWAASPTATVLMTNGARGVVALDVTADVTAYLGGSAADFGWLLKRTDEGPSGAVDFGSRESATAPRLVLTVQ